ncbi:cytochrome p450, partial [Trifolium pratense]
MIRLTGVIWMLLWEEWVFRPFGGSGLKNGDPLSPFLFLLAAESLHVLMEAMVARNLFTRYSVGELAPMTVSHL